MAAPPLSPIAPARIGALIVPAGELKKSRFDAFERRLKAESVVRLGDISPDQRPDRNAFSPLAFPNGVLLYNFITAKPPEAHDQLFPFELFRAPFVVIGLADGVRLQSRPVGGQPDPDYPPSINSELVKDLENGLRKQFLQPPVVQLLIFDSLANIPDSAAMVVPPKAQSRTTTMKTIMCDISAKLLSELSVFARTIQSQENIYSPGNTRSSNPPPLLNRHTSLKEGSLLKDGIEPSSRLSSLDRQQQKINSLDGDERSSRRMSSPASSALAPSLQRRERSRSPVGHEVSPPRLNSNSTVDLRERPLDTLVSRVRDSSRDRRSLQSPPSISPSERAKSTLRLRQGLVVAHLYLMAGRWPDALREQVDNATRAKVFGDQLWYAKGLEGILATMLLLAWARIDFSIPPICFSNPERSVSLKHIPSGNLIRSSQSMDSNDGQASRSLSNLSMVAPELIQNILSNYRREDGMEPEILPQFPLSESVLRLSFLMTVIQRAGGQLNERAIKHLVIGSPSLPVSRHSQQNLGISRFHNTDIAGLIYQAFPTESQISSMPLNDVVTIYSGIISVLSASRLYRKRAMVVREAISMLIPRLIQARKVGAAEMGIHPAASLAARHGLTVDSASGAPILGGGDKEIDFHDLLALLCNVFGVPGVTSSLHENRARSQVNTVSTEALDRIRLEAVQRPFGGFELKSEILRLCANFSESLPNFHDVIQFTSLILQTAGPGSAPGSDLSKAVVQLPREEQLRFATKLTRTLAVFKAGDAARLEADYWDPFLVRDVNITDGDNPSVYLSSGQLESANLIQDNVSSTHDSRESGGRVTTVASSMSIIAEDTTNVAVTLQNLYDFELNLESLQLVTEGATLDCPPQSHILRPRALQKIMVPVVAREEGEMKVAACRVKVQGCREQLFQIFPDVWSPPVRIKIKTSGLNALHDLRERPASTKPEGKNSADTKDKFPIPVVRTFKVVSPQPRLTATFNSTVIGSLDLLEGESKPLSLTVLNQSKAIPVNFLRLSFEYQIDGESRSKRSTFGSATGLKHLEMISSRTTQDNLRSITPGKSTNLKLDVHGQIGLVKAFVHIYYAYFQHTDQTEETTKIPTRRLSVPLSVSVHPSIRVDSLSMIGSYKRQAITTNKGARTQEQLVATDAFNAWLAPLSVTFSPKDDTPATTVEPSQSSRLFVPTSNLPHLRDSSTRDQHEEPPTWNIHWRELSSNRKGHVPIDPTRIEALFQQNHSVLPLSIHFSVHTPGPTSSISQISTDTHQIPTQSFITLRVVLTNTSTKPIQPLLRFDPSLASRSLSAEDISKHLAWTGTLRQAVPMLAPEATVEREISLCALSSGRFVVDANVSDFRALAVRPTKGEGAGAAELGRGRCVLVAQNKG